MYDSLQELIKSEINKFFVTPLSKRSQKRYRIRKPYWSPELNSAWVTMHNSEKAFFHFKGPNRIHQNLFLEYKTNMHRFDKLLKKAKRQYDRGFLVKLDEIMTNDPYQGSSGTS